MSGQKAPCLNPNFTAINNFKFFPSEIAIKNSSEVCPKIERAPKKDNPEGLSEKGQ